MRSHPVPVLAMPLLALAGAAIGAAWLARPASYPFGPADRVTMSVSHVIPYRVAGGLLLAAGALGLTVTAVARRSAAARSAARAAGVGAALLAAFFALVMADASVISLLGYALALGGPVAAVVVIARSAIRAGRGGRTAGGLLLLALLAGTAAGLVDLDTPARFAANVLRGFAGYGSRLTWGLAMAALAAGWAWVAHRLLRADPARGRPGWAEPERVRRWGTAVTVGAALCPLPYAAVRLSWLTPWAIGLDSRFDDPAVRIQGAALGCAAVLGAVLTLGLVSRWGEVAPRWVPVVGGRVVPPRLAIVPGAVVAGAVCVAAPGLLLHAVETDGFGAGGRGILLSLLFFPFPVWGPLLAAAVLAYRLRRAVGGLI